MAVQRRFLDLPIRKPGRQLIDALSCALAYYGRSESKEAVILHLRLNHLYNLRFLVRRRTSLKDDMETGEADVDESAILFLDSPTHSLHLIAHLWRQLRSPKYGLNRKLIDAMMVTEVGQASSDRAQSSISYFSLCDDDANAAMSFHSRFCHYFEKAMTALDTILLDEATCELEEQNHLLILDEWITAHPSDTNLYNVSQRKNHNLGYYTDETMKSWLVHCQDEIDKLATATSNTKYWSPKKREKFALLGTGDDTLEAITDKAKRSLIAKSKAKGKRAHEESLDNDIHLSSELQPLPSRRSCTE